MKSQELPHEGDPKNEWNDKLTEMLHIIEGSTAVQVSKKLEELSLESQKEFNKDFNSGSTQRHEVRAAITQHPDVRLYVAIQEFLDSNKD